MFKRLTLSIGSSFLMVAGLLAPIAQGADKLPLKQHAYFIAEDEAGIDQVWRVLSDTGEMAPITQAASDILNFAVPHDALTVVYNSDGALWMQVTSGAAPLDEPRQLVDLASDGLSTLLFSADDSLLAYSDNGIHIFDLATQTSSEVLANGEPDATTGFAVSYAPQAFIDNNHLSVTIYDWEWLNSGVLNLATGELSALERGIHNYLLPLTDGRLLAYGNGGVAGEFNLEITTADDLATREILVDFADVTDLTLYATAAIELEGGIVRVSGDALDTRQDPAMSVGFVFDVDLNAQTVVAASFTTFTLPNALTDGLVAVGGFNSDGTFIALYTNLEAVASGLPKGDLALYEVATGEIFTLDKPVMQFR